MPRLYNFCFTISHKEIYQEINWKKICEDKHIRYIIFQEEKAKNFHVQGYAEINPHLSIKGIKKLFDCNKHFSLQIMQ